MSHLLLYVMQHLALDLHCSPVGDVYVLEYASNLEVALGSLAQV